MKTNSLKRFFIHLLLYTAIAMSLYYLYSPLNSHPNNATRSSTHFVYQQF